MSDIPGTTDPRIPGRIAICELCGHYVNNFQPEGAMKWCPYCRREALRDDCPHCHAPIPFPPRMMCLACGLSLTVVPMVDQGDGSPGEVTVVEPTAERRAHLESKGSHWHDVVKGDAEGPEMEKLNLNPPPGWTQEEWEKKLHKAFGGEIPPDVLEKLQAKFQPAPPQPDVLPDGTEAPKPEFFPDDVQREWTCPNAACKFAGQLHWVGPGQPPLATCVACNTQLQLLWSDWLCENPDCPRNQQNGVFSSPVLYPNCDLCGKPLARKPEGP